jgi:16S rRNA G527 N7-methylase RsmG
MGRRARRVGVPFSPELGSRLEIYYRLLTAWNTKINLTGLDLSDPSPETLDRLLIEPLVAARHSRRVRRACWISGAAVGHRRFRSHWRFHRCGS